MSLKFDCLDFFYLMIFIKIDIIIKFQMDKGSCCFCLSIRAGGMLIGISVCGLFVHYLLSAIFLPELLLYFSVNAFLYGMVSFFFLHHNFSKERNYYRSSNMFFSSYMVLIYLISNAWNFTFWYCMPDYLARACEYEEICIKRF